MGGMVTDPAGKGAYVREMFAAIAPRYDRANKLLTAGVDEAWRRRAIRELAAPRGGRVADLCCGTGDLVFHLLKTDPALEVTGVDFTVRHARRRASPRPARGPQRPRRLRRGRRDRAAVRGRELRRGDDGLLHAQRRRRRRDAARSAPHPAARRALRQPRRHQARQPCRAPPVRGRTSTGSSRWSAAWSADRRPPTATCRTR